MRESRTEWMGMIFKKLKQSSLYIIALAFLFSSTILPISVFALDEQFYSGNDILFYKPDEQSITNNPCASLTTPQINDKVKLAAAINQYIQGYSDRSGQKSPFIGLGQSFVDSAINNGVNPFIGVLHSQKESGFATATNKKDKNWFTYVFATEQAALSRDENQKVESYNSFGRSSSESQPTAWYPSSGGPRRVYKWASWQDSLTGADSFFVYYKRKWIDESGYTTIGQVIKEYAPATDRNIPNEYASFMYENLSKLIEISGDSISCGGLVTGGMDLEQAKAFMETYKKEGEGYLGSNPYRDCGGGVLANCVAFSVYFINKYTSLKGFKGSRVGHGRAIVDNILLNNKDVIEGKTPEVYSVFSRYSGESGHTGLVLGIDTANNKLIIGEASCGAGPSGITAVEKSLSEWTNNSDYTYAHISNYIKNL